MNYGLSLEEIRDMGVLNSISSYVMYHIQIPTTLLAMCMAGDNIYNLHLSLDQYKDQLEEIDGMKLGYALKYYTDWLYIFPMIV